MWRKPRESVYSLSPPGGWLQDVSVEVKPDETLSLLGTREGKVHNFINTVINGPVKLLRLITG